MSVKSNKKSEIKYHVNVEEFIPYAAHFDEETLLTKNGELLQVIKVKGYSFNLKKDGENNISLRDMVRASIKKNIQSDDFAVWIHTIRRRSDISSGGVFNQVFSKEINERWAEENQWRTQFINELYITIIIEGETISLKNPKNFINSLFVETEMQDKRNKFTNSALKLSKATNGIIDDLSQVGAKKLSIFKRKGVYYSEIMSLLSKIMNLRHDDVPLLPNDLSEIMPTHTVTFQYNSVQVEGPTGRHFGTLFSIKSYSEIKLDELDKLIQLPVNFIITECFNFVESKEAIPAFEEQKKIFDISNANNLREISGLKEIFAKEIYGDTDFANQQIIITVLEDTIKNLQLNLLLMVEALREIGIPFIREDLFVEDCYWSSLPANFDFIKRQGYVFIEKVAGFASLHNYTSGKLVDNYWGDALTTFMTSAGRPYFFSLHEDKNGHTAIFGPDNKHKKMLQNFLITQAQKFNCQTIFVEMTNSSELLVRALGGKYNNLEASSSLDNLMSDQVLGLKINNLSQLDDIVKNLQNKENNNPMIVVFSEDISSSDDEQFITKLEEWLKIFIAKNIVAIFSVDTDKTKKGIFNENIKNLIKTRIYVANPNADYNYSDDLGLLGRELKLLKKLSESEGEFLLKKGDEIITAKFNPKVFNKQQSILLSEPDKLQIFDEAMQQSANEAYNNWTNLFYSKLGL